MVLLRKELQLELAAKDGLPLALAFSVVCLLTLNFALAPGQAAEPGYSAAGLWVSVLFGSVLLFNRALLREREAGGFLALSLSPADPGLVYLAKAAGTFLMVLGLELGTALAAGFFFNADLARLWGCGGAALVLGALGLSALGTLQAAMAVHLRPRDAVLPLLLFPLQIPILIFGGRAVLDALSGNQEGGLIGLAAMAGFDILFLAAGYLLFSFLMEE